MPGATRGPRRSRRRPRTTRRGARGARSPRGPQSPTGRVAACASSWFAWYRTTASAVRAAPAVVVRCDRVQQLRPKRGLELSRALVDESNPELDVAEQRALGRRTERRAASELAHPPDVVEQSGGEEEIGAEPLVELRRLAAERRDPDRVLQQPAGVAVVAVRARGGQVAHPLPDLAVVEHTADDGREPRVRELRSQELEEAVELVGVPAHRRRELGGVGLGRLDRPHLELQAPVEALDAGQHADGVALLEAAVEQLDVVPDAPLDAPARVDELEREVGLAVPRREAALARDREDTVDRAVLDEVGDRCHGLSLEADLGYRHVRPRLRTARRGRSAPPGVCPRRHAPLAHIRPLWAPVGSIGGRRPPVSRRPLRTAERGGDGPAVRRDRRRGVRGAPGARPPQRRPPHLRDGRARRGGAPRELARRRDARPRRDARGLVPRAGLRRSRRCRAPARRDRGVAPRRAVRGGRRPAARADARRGARGPPAPPARDAHAARAHLPPLRGRPAARATVHGARRRHRRDPALARRGRRGGRGVLPAAAAPDRRRPPPVRGRGRIRRGGRGRPDARRARLDRRPGAPGLPDPPRLRRQARDRPDGRRLPHALRTRGRRSTPSRATLRRPSSSGRAAPGSCAASPASSTWSSSTASGSQGISYTPDADEALRRVGSGEADCAFLLRPLRIADVFDRARQGRTMPPKATYFFPKLLSGLLLHPLEP